MWPFNRRYKEKSSSTTVITAGADIGPEWVTSDYRAFAEEGFNRNSVVNKVISDIAKFSSSVRWDLFTKKNDDTFEKVTESNDINNVLTRPNPSQSWCQFVYSAISYLLLSGNMYVEAVTLGDKDDPTQPVKQLLAKRPDRMTVLKGDTALIGGYKYEVNGRKMTWAVDPISGLSNILHNKLFNPIDDYYGLSPVQVAANGVDTNNAANTWNMHLLKNSAKSSGILVSKEPVAIDRLRRLKSEVRNKWSGMLNAGKPMVLEGSEWQWIQTSMSPQDMDWSNNKNQSARDICYAFGYPPFLLGLPDNNATFNNQEQAALWLWENTISFYLEMLKTSFNYWWIARESDDLFIDYDLTGVPALSSRRDKQLERAKALDGIAEINERRALVKLPPKPEGNVILVPSGVIPLEALSEIIASEDSDKQLAKLFKQHGMTDTEINKVLGFE